MSKLNLKTVKLSKSKTDQNFDLGLKAASLNKLNAVLEVLLADENLLYVKSKNFHWNIEGVNFADHHAFLDQVAAESQQNIDDIAERMRSLGAKVNGNMKNYLAKTTLKESSNLELNAEAMFEELLNDYQNNIKSLRIAVEEAENLNDVVTADFLTGLMSQKEKRAWMIRAITN